MSGARGIAGVVVAMALWFAASASAASWTVLPSPDDGVLNAVACTSPTACTAVGLVGSPAGPGSILAERWNGTSWSVQPEVHPHWLGQSEWTAVSCAGPRFCIAIGDVVFSSSFTGRARSIIGIWRGRNWLVSLPRDGGPGASVSFQDTLGLVSCVSARFCVAGGWGLTSRLRPGSTPSARSWKGTRWSVMRTARGVTAPESVWCATPRACLGISGDAFERWDGSSWSRVGRMPAAHHLESAFWGGLACRSRTSCIDVGLGFPGGDSSGVSLVAEWNGKVWRVNTPEETTNAYPNVFWGPSSCTAAVGCLVLGNKATGGVVSAEQSASLWTGTRWTAFPAPSATTMSPSAPIVFGGVSCVTKTCIAVGSTSSSPARTLIERYT